MKVVWISANKLGYELLKEAVCLKCVLLGAIITLSKTSKTVMYDGVAQDSWNDFGADVYKIKDINKEKALIRKLNPDLLVLCGWRQIVNKDILNIPRKGVIATHPTLLPYGRGPAPIINTILRGDKVSGLTLFYVTDGLDNGDVIGQERFSILDSDHAGEVYNKIILSGRKLVKKYFPKIADGTVKATPQDESKAVIFTRPTLKNNNIDLADDSLEDAYRKIKALSKPYKGAFVERDGKRLVIWRAELKDLNR